MIQKILTIGFDTETPVGVGIHKSELRKHQVNFLHKLNSVYDREATPRTFFVLGKYLEDCLGDFSESDLQEALSTRNKLTEIQQHSYSHIVFKENNFGKALVSLSEFRQDLQRAGDVIEKILKIRTNGLRTPYGYENDLVGEPEHLRVLQELSINYVSSQLRSKNTIYNPLQKSTQPHRYSQAGYHDIWEVPSHGWQDVIFTREKARKYRVRYDDMICDVAGHYEKLFKEADKINLPTVVVSLCFHPWAVREYDSDLGIHRRIIASARDVGFDIMTYQGMINFLEKK